MSQSIHKWSFYHYGTMRVGYLPTGGSQGLLLLALGYLDEWGLCGLARVLAHLSVPAGVCVSSPLLEAAVYPAGYPCSSKLAPPGFAETISPVGESPCMCTTSLIPFSIRFASLVGQTHGDLLRGHLICTHFYWVMKMLFLHGAK